MEEVINGTINGQKVKLYSDGTFFINGEKRDWYKNTKTGAVWIPKKRSSIIGLIKQILND